MSHLQIFTLVLKDILVIHFDILVFTTLSTNESRKLVDKHQQIFTNTLNEIDVKPYLKSPFYANIFIKDLQKYIFQLMATNNKYQKTSIEEVKLKVHQVFLLFSNMKMFPKRENLTQCAKNYWLIQDHA